MIPPFSPYNSWVFSIHNQVGFGPGTPQKSTATSSLMRSRAKRHACASVSFGIHAYASVGIRQSTCTRQAPTPPKLHSSCSFHLYMLPFHF
ncbi:uncharacterized protein DS421_1g03500 [Arachis hypogaea]|nr:uncharacterized protein DS421_1g03500 [Arachis hypogaea]